ncbi:NAD(P)-binding domain-containing protein [Salicibibacter cibarius]|uniref:NAD(P)-binding domain-containing protein n=1 Tax=Salicibibacter cibarius TaxID=2743000 RepID=A0A7T6Z6B3_9BACI|nr:NAD(P)-binding domain-containing protein [Salicibibacter cibarius]QQK77790.1 NAD(P)-binding domain-containing protein [Salicibibacter cibarius]
MIDLAIIGAGPYGLSLAAHAKESNINYKVFGYPMDFWASKIPPNMYVRTSLEYTGLSDRHNEYTLKNYQLEKGIDLFYPLSRNVFVDYAFWFIKKTDIDIEKALITNVISTDGFYIVQTENGNSYKAKKVIVAVGLTNAQYIPNELYVSKKNLVTHSSDYTTFDEFVGQHVLVVGGGQSAWETAALLHQANAEVELVYRRSERLKPQKNMNAKQQEISRRFYYFSKQYQDKIKKELEKATVSDFLVPLVEGKVKQRPNTFITYVLKTHDNKVHVKLNDQTSLIVDHVIAATGFRFSVNNISFLNSIHQNIAINDSGDPVLNEYFESTVPNLFFTGPAAATSHGPAYRFIAGLWATCDILIPYIKKTL